QERRLPRPARRSAEAARATAVGADGLSAERGRYPGCETRGVPLRRGADLARRSPLASVRCFYCETPIRGPAEVDHFIPWARHPDNGIENLVAADARCNNDMRDFVASTEHLQRWKAAHFDPGGRPVEALERISSTLGWESHPDQTLAVARSIYLR